MILPAESFLGSRMYECFHLLLASFYLTALLQERDYGRENREKCKVSEWCTREPSMVPSTLNCHLHNPHVGVRPSVAKH